MVASKRDLGNIHFSISALTSIMTHMALLPAPEVMDIDNYNDIRRRKSSPNKASSRSAFISSSISFQPYYKRIVLNNDLSDEEIVEPVNSSQLSYKDKSKKRNTVSKATDYESTRRQQCASNEAPALDTSTVQHVDNDIINIQLPYMLWNTLDTNIFLFPFIYFS